MSPEHCNLPKPIPAQWTTSTGTFPNTTHSHFETNALVMRCFIISFLNNDSIPSTHNQHTAVYPHYFLSQTNAARVPFLLCCKLLHNTHTGSALNTSVRRHTFMFCRGKTWGFHSDGKKMTEGVSAESAAAQHMQTTAPETRIHVVTHQHHNQHQP